MVISLMDRPWARRMGRAAGTALAAMDRVGPVIVALLAKTLLVAVSICGFSALAVCVFLVAAFVVLLWPVSGALMFVCWLAWMLLCGVWAIVAAPRALIRSR